MLDRPTAVSARHVRPYARWRLKPAGLVAAVLAAAAFSPGAAMALSTPSPAPPTPRPTPVPGAPTPTPVLTPTPDPSLPTPVPTVSPVPTPVVLPLAPTIGLPFVKNSMVALNILPASDATDTQVIRQYEIHFGSRVLTVPYTYVSFSGLEPATDYPVSIRAIDEWGNASEPVTTTVRTMGSTEDAPLHVQYRCSVPFVDDLPLDVTWYSNLPANQPAGESFPESDLEAAVSPGVETTAALAAVGHSWDYLPNTVGSFSVVGPGQIRPVSVIFGGAFRPTSETYGPGVTTQYTNVGSLPQLTFPRIGQTTVSVGSLAVTVDKGSFYEPDQLPLNCAPVPGQDLVLATVTSDTLNYPTPTPTPKPGFTPAPSPTPWPWGDGTATPTPVPTPTPSPTPIPTAEPTPTPVRTPGPGETPVPSPTNPVQTPTPTPMPTPNRTPDKPTPTPTITPTPTATPQSTVTPKPTATPTPQSTATPVPIVTPVPTVTPTLHPDPTITPAPTEQLIPYAYALAGSATLKSLTKGSLPLSGSIAAKLGLPSGKFTGDLVLAPSMGNLTALGFLPVVAKVNLLPTEQVTGTLKSGKLTAVAKVRIKLPSVKALGIELAGGANCQAKQISSITLTSTQPTFLPLSGGPLAGTFDISDLSGCGFLTGIVSPLTKGSGNAIALNLTPTAVTP